jgi:hypothetical protein
MVEQPQWRSAFRRCRLRGCGSAARFGGKPITRSRNNCNQDEVLVSAGVPVYVGNLRLVVKEMWQEVVGISEEKFC